MVNTPDNWKKELSKTIKESKKVTEFNDPKNRNWGWTDSPNYGTFEVSPSLKLDVNNTHFLSGTEASIMQQASLLKALHDVLGFRLGYLVDFEIWFQDFSREFKVNPITGMPRFEVEQPETLTYWGKENSNRPKFEWYHPSSITNPTEEDSDFYKKTGYFVIKFWRDRNLLNEFEFVSGTLPEIRMQLINKMQTVNVNGDDSDDLGKTAISESKLLSGFPEIKIKFWQVEKVAGSKVRYDSVFSITLIGWGESVEENQPRTLSIADLKEFKRNIENAFYGGGVPHILKRGKEIHTYQDWKKGYANWGKFFNEQEAINLYQKLVTIKGDTFDPYAMRPSKEVTVNPALSNPINVLGESKAQKNSYPIVDLQFWQAWVWLPKTTQKIMLCSRSLRSPVDPRLL